MRPSTDLRFSRNERYGHCGVKLRHEHILSAYAHANELEKINREFYTCYPCRICGFIHVGRDQHVRRWRKGLRKLEQIMGSEFSAKAPIEVQLRFRNIRFALRTLLRVRERERGL